MSPTRYPRRWTWQCICGLWWDFGENGCPWCGKRPPGH